MHLKTWLLFLFLSLSIAALAQDKGSFSGSLQTNVNYFIKDEAIGAVNIPQYDQGLVGVDTWLNLNYSFKGYNAGVRLDYFKNSNLLIPTSAYSDQGLGKAFINKRFDKLFIELGYIYSQIGSGIIFRSYEERPLLIDNALVGAKASYDIDENWTASGFVGKQKNQFSLNEGLVKGGSIEGYYATGSEDTPLSFSPGIGFVNRTHSQQTVDRLVNIVKQYIGDERIGLKYNTYLTSIFNSLNYEDLTLYVEYAYKSAEAFRDPTSLRTELTGQQTIGKFVNEPGSVLYTSLNFGDEKLGVTVELKRTENFNFKTDPTLTGIMGLAGYLPPMSRENTYRLTSRYTPTIQDLSERAIQTEIRYRHNKKLSALINLTRITDLEDDLLYREYFFQMQYKQKRKWLLIAGLQSVIYNQEVFEVKPNVPLVKTITPFADFLYRFTNKRSLRTELQYLNTAQDFGSWAYGLVEVGLAPHWLFELSGMYNVDPVKGDDKIFYPTLGAVYNFKTHRLGIRYVKQVEGIVCAGGICRLEPAFSGVKFTINSTF